MMKDKVTGLKYSVDGKFKMPCKLINGKIEENFMLHLFTFQTNNKYTGLEEHFHVITLGNIEGKKNILMRIESACICGHVYGSQLCDCQFQLQQALKKISDEGLGIYVYCLDQHGRGIGIVNQAKVYQIQQERDLDSSEANKSFGLPEDARNYEPIIAILNYFNIKSVKLFTNNPKRLEIFKKYGIPVTRLALKSPTNRWNKMDLETKKKKFGHLL